MNIKRLVCFMIGIVSLLSLLTDFVQSNMALFGILIFVGCMAIFMAIGWNQMVKPVLEGYDFDELISYNGQERTLFLMEKGAEIAKAVKIVEDVDITISHEPEKLHVGAVTVGGVTTGGTYTTGGYNYVSGTKKNDKYRLHYKRTKDYQGTINTIQLTDELYEDALNSPIKDFLNDKKQIVVVPKLDVNDLPEFDRMMLLENLKRTGYVGNKYAKMYLPSKEKCSLILNWMTEETDEEQE